MVAHARKSLAVALDVPFDEAKRLAPLLAADAGYLKIGLSLFVAEGPAVVHALKTAGARVFLDLKLHDIPNTVELAAKAAGALGVDLLTIHASGGPSMIAAAVKGAAEGARGAGVAPPKILAVTVLTSISADELARIGIAGSAEENVGRLAKLAVDSGAQGIVCSPREAKVVRAMVGEDPLIVTPGIRPAGADKDDQARAETVEAALDAGADVLVVGRPITQAKEPAKAARELAAQIAAHSRGAV